MSGLSMTVEGVKEATEALEKLKMDVPAEVTVALNAGLQPIAQAMKQYPPQPPYMGMRSYGARRVTYVRTNNYQDRITIPPVRRVGSEFIGYINSPATYSTYLRGDLSGYGGAWMHRGIWRTLQSIIDDLWPKAAQRIEQQLDRLIKRLRLGD